MANGLKNVRIEYTMGATINTGDFSNVKPEFTLSADVEDGTHPTDAKDRVVALVDSWLEKRVKELRDELAQG